MIIYFLCQCHHVNQWTEFIAQETGYEQSFSPRRLTLDLIFSSKVHKTMSSFTSSMRFPCLKSSQLRVRLFMLLSIRQNTAHVVEAILSRLWWRCLRGKHETRPEKRTVIKIMYISFHNKVYIVFWKIFIFSPAGRSSTGTGSSDTDSHMKMFCLEL